MDTTTQLHLINLKSCASIICAGKHVHMRQSASPTQTTARLLGTYSKSEIRKVVHVLVRSEALASCCRHSGRDFEAEEHRLSSPV